MVEPAGTEERRRERGVEYIVASLTRRGLFVQVLDGWGGRGSGRFGVVEN